MNEATSSMLDADRVTRLFTRADGQYLFARWGRPIAPVIFGVEDQTIGIVKGAFEALCHLTGHQMSETDPELGANCMVFFFRDWDELLSVPNLDRLVSGLDAMVADLSAAGANQYRVFRFDPQGAIQAVFVFLRMDEGLLSVPAETLVLSQVLQSMLLWSETAFDDTPPLADAGNGQTVLRPDIAAILRAAYDPVLPDRAEDKSHAMRIAARAAQTVQ